MDDKKAFLQAVLPREKKLVGAPAPIVPFANWDFYYTQGPIVWKPPVDSEFKESVVVPIGFVTDLASIPQIFWSILPREGEYTYPAIIHDFLYWNQALSRQQSDDVLKLAMNDMGVSSVKVFAIYNAVRAAGQAAWNGNAAAKKAGEKRILKIFPDDFSITWDIWREKENVFL